MADADRVTLEDRELRILLGEARTIAVVGLSSKRSRPSFDVAKYLKEHGYRIVPVNPNETEVLGERAYPTLLELPDDRDRSSVAQDRTELLVAGQVGRVVARHGRPRSRSSSWCRIPAVAPQIVFPSRIGNANPRYTCPSRGHSTVVSVAASSSSG